MEPTFLASEVSLNEARPCRGCGETIEMGSRALTLTSYPHVLLRLEAGRFHDWDCLRRYAESELESEPETSGSIVETDPSMVRARRELKEWVLTEPRPRSSSS